MSEKSLITTLAAEWRQAGVDKGDTILIHSKLSRTLRLIVKMGGQPSTELVLNSLLEAVGDNGTLLLPLFNFDFTKGVPFDIRSSPSAMGALTEAGRLHPAAVRTGHPIYSFAAIGANASRFAEVDNYSGYGPDSPFAILRELDGKIGVIDLPDQNSMTFYHHVEELCGVDYRYHKSFRGPYTNWHGHEAEKEYGLFVRNIEKGVLTHVNPMGEILWEEGLYTGCRPNEGSGLRVARANQIFKRVSKTINEGQALGLLYKTEN